MAARIKSPLLYQLSYRPNITEQFGKLRSLLGWRAPSVPLVYPNTASGSTLPAAPESDDDVMAGLRRVTT